MLHQHRIQHPLPIGRPPSRTRDLDNGLYQSRVFINPQLLGKRGKAAEREGVELFRQPILERHVLVALEPQSPAMPPPAHQGGQHVAENGLTRIPDHDLGDLVTPIVRRHVVGVPQRQVIALIRVAFDDEALIEHNLVLLRVEHGFNLRTQLPDLNSVEARTRIPEPHGVHAAEEFPEHGEIKAFHLVPGDRTVFLNQFGHSVEARVTVEKVPRDRVDLRGIDCITQLRIRPCQGEQQPAQCLRSVGGIVPVDLNVFEGRPGGLFHIEARRQPYPCAERRQTRPDHLLTELHTQPTAEVLPLRTVPYRRIPAEMRQQIPERVIPYGRRPGPARVGVGVGLARAELDNGLLDDPRLLLGRRRPAQHRLRPVEDRRQHLHSLVDLETTLQRLSEQPRPVG